MIDQETPQPYWMTFDSLEAFAEAMDKIETWDKSRPKVIEKSPNAPDPDLSKPYTYYDVDNLRIWADNDVMNLLT